MFESKLTLIRSNHILLLAGVLQFGSIHAKYIGDSNSDEKVGIWRTPRQTDSDDSSDGSAHYPEFRKTVGADENADELSDENGSSCSDFLIVPLPDYDLERHPPTIYDKDNSSDIFPEFFPKLKSRTGIGKGKGRKGCHITSEDNLKNNENAEDDDDDDDYMLGGYTKPIQTEPLILKRSREDIRAELVFSDDSEFDEDPGGYTTNKLDQPIIINRDGYLGCTNSNLNTFNNGKIDEVSIDRTVEQSEENEALENGLQPDSNDSEYIDYTVNEENNIPQIDAAHEDILDGHGTLSGGPDSNSDNNYNYFIQNQQKSEPRQGDDGLEWDSSDDDDGDYTVKKSLSLVQSMIRAVDDGLEWDSSDDDNGGYTIGKSLVEPIIIKPSWDVDDGLEWDSSDADTQNRNTTIYPGIAPAHPKFALC